MMIDLECQYLDENNEIVRCTFDEFKKADRNRRVARDETPRFVVSTVLLCMDHSYFQDGSQNFETMVFDKTKPNKYGHDDVHCRRHRTFEQAKGYHEKLLNLLAENNDKPLPEFYGDEESEASGE